jgi:hypothetical protein
LLPAGTNSAGRSAKAARESPVSSDDISLRVRLKGGTAFPSEEFKKFAGRQASY